MRLEQLEYLLEISKTKSISLAAENLFVSQPAISKSMQLLERELGVELLCRDVKKGISVTAAAREILPLAEEILQKVMEIGKIGNKYKEIKPKVDVRDELHIVMWATTLDTYLVDAVDRFHQIYPNVTVWLRPLETVDDSLFGNESYSDLSIILNSGNCFAAEMEKFQLKTVKIFETGFDIVVSKDSDLAKKTFVSYNMFNDKKIIVTNSGTFQDRLHKQNFGEVYDNIYLKSNNIALIKKLLQGKSELLFLSNTLFTNYNFNNDDNYAIIPIKDDKAEFVALYKEDGSKEKLISVLLDNIKYVVRNSAMEYQIKRIRLNEE